ncbi:hypothetical protein D3C80_1987280 [compost metagenome]
MGPDQVQARQAACCGCHQAGKAGAQQFQVQTKDQYRVDDGQADGTGQHHCQRAPAQTLCPEHLGRGLSERHQHRRHQRHGNELPGKR